MQKVIRLLTIIIPIFILIGLITGCTDINDASSKKLKPVSATYFYKGVYKTEAPEKKNSYSYFYIFYDGTSGYTAESGHGIGLPYSCVQSEGVVKFRFGSAKEPEKVFKIKSVNNGVIKGSFEDGILIIFTPTNINPDNFNAVDADIDTLTKIDKFQEEYFEIIKRNNVLLQLSKNDEYEKDQKDLDNLYKKVESSIPSDCEFLKKYKNIEQEFEKNTGENTFEINDFNQKHYDAVDKLLNDTYKAVKTKIPETEFNKLVKSEINWLKEVENYRVVFDSQSYGSIGGSMFLNYQINMRNFRTLLLMLYLK